MTPTMDKVQSIWRNYAFRYPFADSAEHRYGYVCQVHGQALQVSTVMAPASRFLRYFHAEVVRSNQDFELHPKKMTRYVWKDATEDVYQQWYDPVLAELLPSYRLYNLYHLEGRGKVVNRKLAKDSLRYPRFRFYAPVLQLGPDDITQRANHFKLRLSEFLPWIASQSVGTQAGKYICTPVPSIERSFCGTNMVCEYCDLQLQQRACMQFAGTNVCAE